MLNSISNKQRVKLLFGEIKQGSAQIAATAVRVLPRLLLDFFSVDQMLLFVLGQFDLVVVYVWGTKIVVNKTL